MARLDPRLTALRSRGEPAIFKRRARSELLAAMPKPGAKRLRLLVHLTGSRAALEAIDFRVTSEAGDILAGTLPESAIEALANLTDVSVVEWPGPLRHELDHSLPKLRVPEVWTRPGGTRGANVIVGVIDSGIDFRHPVFKDGKQSCILAMWDQSRRADEAKGESPPKEFDYGVEHTRDRITAAINGGPPLPEFSEREHGTAVAGVAVGRVTKVGAHTISGVAPEADLAFVACTRGTVLGDSAMALDAITYLLKLARREKKQIVINMSLGDNLGAHDGSSLLERALDNLLGQPGEAFVNSAGNEGNKNSHARADVAAGSELILTLAPNQPNASYRECVVDIWYDGDARLDAALRRGTATTTFVSPDDGTRHEFVLGPLRIAINSEVDRPGNHANRIRVHVVASSDITTPVDIVLRHVKGSACRVDAWIDDVKPRPQFATHASAECTVTIPGTARSAITVGAYVNTLSPLASTGTSFGESSQGPDRGHTVTLPHVSAPGAPVVCPSPLPTGVTMPSVKVHSGTSIAAPHVAGVVALLLATHTAPRLTQTQIRSLLQRGVFGADGHTGVLPNTTWGAGKVDAVATMDGTP